MIRIMRALGVAVTAAVLVAVLVTLDAGGRALADAGTPPGADEQAYVTARCAEAIPDCSGSVAGATLTLSVSQADLNALPGSDDPAFAVPARPSDPLGSWELEWKFDLIAGVAAAGYRDITGWQATWPGITYRDPPYERHGLYIAPTNYPRLGTVDAQGATQQLASSLSVVHSVYPPGTITASRIVVVPVNAAANLFGLEAQIRTPDMADLKPHIGDIVQGLETGLTGDQSATIEGLSIQLMDDAGHRSGWWSAVRAGSGAGLEDPSVSQCGYTPDTTFPNLTGGPRTVDSGCGGGGGRAKAPPRARTIVAQIRTARTGTMSCAGRTRSGVVVAKGRHRVHHPGLVPFPMRLTDRGLSWRASGSGRPARLRITSTLTPAHGRARTTTKLIKVS
jgi:hypothetical protein